MKQKNNFQASISEILTSRFIFSELDLHFFAREFQVKVHKEFKTMPLCLCMPIHLTRNIVILGVNLGKVFSGDNQQ
jgi:hypothetical protein